MNRRFCLSALVAFVLLTVVSSGWALDLRDGRILLSLDEKTARFTLHYLADAARNRYIPLLYEQEPRTSFPTLVWNGKTYRLGESSDFRFTVKKEAATAVIDYKSSFANIRQVFRLVRSAGSADVDGVLVDFSIENVSGSPADAGLCLLWDTYLGERNKRHFEMDGYGVVSAETALVGASVPRRVISPGETGTALQIQLSGEGLSRPDRFLLANWKRINDSGWKFEPVAGRGFTLLPYSIDDSAVALYYDPVELRDGAVRVIRTALGNRSEGGYSSTQPLSVDIPPSADSTRDGAPIKPEAVVPSSGSDPFVAARTDIAALREILRRIDELLSSRKDPSQEELNELRVLLDRIKARGKGF